MAKKRRKARVTRIGPRYEFSDAPRVFKNGAGADPEVIGQSLAAIAAAHANRLRPQHVVDAARAPRHPLHKHFEWNVDKAAQAHWLDTARSLCRAVVLVNPSEPVSSPRHRMPAWLSVKDPKGIAYRDIDQVVNEVDFQLAVMRRALADLEAWQSRYHSLEDICGGAVASARAQLIARIQAREKKAA